jgi:hypothetical protein
MLHVISIVRPRNRIVIGVVKMGLYTGDPREQDPEVPPAVDSCA